MAVELSSKQGCSGVPWWCDSPLLMVEVVSHLLIRLGHSRGLLFENWRHSAEL